MAQHNLGTVVSFELTRTLTKARFWVATLAVPVIAGIVFALVFISNTSIAGSADEQKDAKFSISYVDASGLVDESTAQAFGATKATDRDAAIAEVKDGSLDAFFSYPQNPATQKIELYAKDQGLFDNGKYDAVAKAMLAAAANAKIGSPELSALASGDTTTTLTAYGENGQESGGFNGLIGPLAYLVIFFGLTILLTNQMLNATLEEKENRVTEMILTTLKPTTLITGKVISLCVVGVVQALVFVAPIVIGYLGFREQLNFPTFDLTTLALDPWRMLVGALILIGGFLLFMTTMVAVGAVMPTAKEAASASGPMIALVFVPLYVVSLIISDPGAMIVQIFTYIPYSAPTTALLRNAFGTLGTVEAIIVIAIIYIAAFVMLRLAVKLFQQGSIAYGNKLSLKSAFSRK